METTKQTLIDFFENFKQSIDYNDFYSISFTSYSIKLQGHFTTPLAQRLTEIGFVFEFKQHLNGKLQNDCFLNVEVTLT